MNDSITTFRKTPEERASERAMNIRRDERRAVFMVFRRMHQSMSPECDRLRLVKDPVAEGDTWRKIRCPKCGWETGEAVRP